MTGSDTVAGDYFGYGMAMSADGSMVLVGAWGKRTFVGAAYVFAANRLTLTVPAAALGDTSSLIVTAMDVGGNTISSYAGTVHFASSDTRAILPSDYTFTVADHGSHTFAITFRSVGAQTVSAVDSQIPVVRGSTATTVPPPALSGMSPGSGPVGGGDVVTLTGLGFEDGATVTFGGVQAMDVVLVDNASLRVTTPAHGAGSVDVAVYVGGGSATLRGAYTYLAPGTLPGPRPSATVQNTVPISLPLVPRSTAAVIGRPQPLPGGR
jgi:hypothetical protein